MKLLCTKSPAQFTVGRKYLVIDENEYHYTIKSDACGQAAWGKPELNIHCGDCDTPMCTED